jgi:hypothetical protein
MSTVEMTEQVQFTVDQHGKVTAVVVPADLRRAIELLALEPRPSGSRALDISTLDLPPEVEIRRLRIEFWRLVYAIHAADSWVWVLGLQRRPPYDYADLPDLAQKLRT